MDIMKLLNSYKLNKKLLVQIRFLNNKKYLLEVAHVALDFFFPVAVSAPCHCGLTTNQLSTTHYVLNNKIIHVYFSHMTYLMSHMISLNNTCR
jgi:hypothetical protein